MTDLYEKFPGLVSLLKLQNVLILLIAQLLVACCVYGRHDWWDLLIKEKFILLMLATGSAISAGYIINHFYHVKRDFINRPRQTLMEQKLPVAHQLYLYFFLNFITLVFAYLISRRALIFFAVYIFLIWLYFHKLHHHAFWRELFVVFLTVYPFFGVMLFFKQWNAFVLLAGILFALLLMLKELIKNHLTLRGDMAQNISTVLTEWGEKRQFYLFSFFAGLVLPVVYILLQLPLSASFRYYLYGFSLAVGILWLFYYKKKYTLSFTFIKIIIISGLFALFLL